MQSKAYWRLEEGDFKTLLQHSDVEVNDVRPIFNTQRHDAATSRRYDVVTLMCKGYKKKMTTIWKGSNGIGCYGLERSSHEPLIGELKSI